MTKDNHQQDMIDNELVQLYRRQATEQPSPELDAAILAKAAQRSAPVAEDPQRSCGLRPVFGSVIAGPFPLRLQ